jgi:peptidoglycan/xylan/chitin deacetylase (PgdA/CDA1 family)
LVTFDDGWYDNLQFALPLLERVAVPATVFVATGFVGKHGGFWQERLAAGVDRMCRSPEQHRARLGTLGLDALPAMPDGVRRVAIRDFVTRQKSRSRVEIEQLLREVDAHSDSGFPDGAASTQDRFMTWDELARLARSQRVTLASHGVSHTPFTKLSAEDVCDELEASRQALEERLGVRTTAIAYPNGEFDSRVAEAAERSGYRVGFTTERGFAGDRAQAMTIRRVNVHDGAAPTAAMLLARIVGWF